MSDRYICPTWCRIRLHIAKGLLWYADTGRNHHYNFSYKSIQSPIDSDFLWLCWFHATSRVLACLPPPCSRLEPSLVSPCPWPLCQVSSKALPQPLSICIPFDKDEQPKPGGKEYLTIGYTVCIFQPHTRIDFFEPCFMSLGIPGTTMFASRTWFFFSFFFSVLMSIYKYTPAMRRHIDHHPRQVRPPPTTIKQWRPHRPQQQSPLTTMRTTASEIRREGSRRRSVVFYIFFWLY